MQDSSNRKKNFQKENVATVVKTIGDKPLPHNLKFEKSVLGAILVDGNCLDEAIERFGSSKVFFSSANQKIYDSMLLLHGKDIQIDIITIGKSLSDQGVFTEVGGDIYLAELQQSVATTAHMESWCETVYELAVLRELINACNNSITQCFDTEKDVGEILDSVERSILTARDLGAKDVVKSIKDLVHNSVEYFHKLKNKDETVTGILTGYPGLDEKITGLKRGEMFVLAARPSIGKTSFALNILANVALRRRDPPFSVVMYSLEMTDEQLTRRLLCCEAGISEKEFTNSITNADWNKITNAASTIMKAKVFIDPTPSLKIMELRAKARRLRKREKIDLIIIDYLQLMRADTVSKSDTRQIEVSLISSGIKSLAKELDVPILVLAQLNRAAEQQRDGIPKLSNLRESGAIEQDADIVAFLHRDIEAHREASEDEKSRGLDAQLIIAKNRNGDIGKEELVFFPKIMRFRSKRKYDIENANI